MSRIVRKFGAFAVASLVVLAVAASASAQPVAPGNSPYNSAALGRGISTVPGYGAFTPYSSTTPTLVSNAALPPSSSMPYTMSTAPGTYGAPSYTSYYPPPYTYIPPAGAALMGLASLTSASGEYWNQIQQARITREQSRQAEMDTARKRVEFELWYETVRPTAPKMIAKEKASDLDWARNHAQNTEIWSGRTLNVLLRSILASPSPTRGPNIPLDERTVQGLNLTDKTTRGNLALAKDEGKIDWPEALQEAAYDSSRDRFSKNFSNAIKTAQQGERPPVSMLRDLRNDIKELESKLDDQARDLAPSKFIESRRMLNKLRDTVTGLSDSRICKSCNDTWKKNVRSVAELVEHCMKNGLEFGPAAAAGDDASYSAAYYAMRSYERETVQLSSR
jgi:hypothetical protein